MPARPLPACSLLLYSASLSSHHLPTWPIPSCLVCVPYHAFCHSDISGDLPTHYSPLLSQLLPITCALPFLPSFWSQCAVLSPLPPIPICHLPLPSFACLCPKTRLPRNNDGISPAIPYLPATTCLSFLHFDRHATSMPSYLPTILCHTCLPIHYNYCLCGLFGTHF